MKRFKSIAILLLVLEVCSYLALIIISKVPSLNLVYSDKTTLPISKYLQEREPVTGWPSKSVLASRHYSKNGSRPNPYLVTKSTPKIIVFGDSFARGAEVSDSMCWSNLIIKETGLNIVNYGVNGYGTDQALLRSKSKADSSDILLVVMTPDNIMRNVNSFRNLISPQMSYIGLKPRYEFDRNGHIALKPLPGTEVEHIEEILKNPMTLGRSEYFTSSEGPQRIRFPFTFSFAKVFNHYHIRAKLSGSSFYQRYFDVNHPSNALNITTQILLEFQRVHQDKKILYLFFPQVQDFSNYFENKKWTYQELINSLKKESPDSAVINLGPSFIDQENFENELDSYFAPQKHYSERGNILVSQVVHENLSQLNWLTQ